MILPPGAGPGINPLCAGYVICFQAAFFGFRRGAIAVHRLLRIGGAVQIEQAQRVPQLMDSNILHIHLRPGRRAAGVPGEIKVIEQYVTFQNLTSGRPVDVHCYPAAGKTGVIVDPHDFITEVIAVTGGGSCPAILKVEVGAVNIVPGLKSRYNCAQFAVTIKTILIYQVFLPHGVGQ